MLFKDRFEIESTVDQGRYGTVCRAIDRLRSSPGVVRRVTLTVLPTESTADARALERFKRTFERVKTLIHPGIGRLYDLDCVGKTYFVTSEFIDGETLRNVVDNLRPELLDPDEVDGVMRQVGEALAHAHDLGIVHGSVHAENVVVTMEHDIKLIGFLSTSAFGAAETPADLDEASDVCDLAGLAYFLYTGLAAPRSGPLPRVKGVPKQRRKALEVVLLGDPGWSVREFLERAGLAAAPVRVPTPRAAPALAPRPQPAPPRGRPIADPRPISWRFVVPGLGVAAAAAFAFSGADLEAWLGASGWPDRLAAVRSAFRAQDSDAQNDPQAGGDPELAQSGGSTAESPPTPAAGTVTRRRAPPAANQSDRASATALGVPLRGPLERGRERPAEAAARLSLSQTEITVRESTSVATVEVRRTGAIDTSVDFVWWTSDGSATAINDYASFGSRVETLAPGEETLTLVIPIVSDAVGEPEEFFHVHVDPGPSTAQAGDGMEATVTVIDDDR